MIERQKTKAMVAKCQKTRRGISLSNKKKRNYKTNIEDKRDLD